MTEYIILQKLVTYVCKEYEDCKKTKYTNNMFICEILPDSYKNESETKNYLEKNFQNRIHFNFSFFLKIFIVLHNIIESLNNTEIDFLEIYNFKNKTPYIGTLNINIILEHIFIIFKNLNIFYKDLNENICKSFYKILSENLYILYTLIYYLIYKSIDNINRINLLKSIFYLEKYQYNNLYIDILKNFKKNKINLPFLKYNTYNIIYEISIQGITINSKLKYINKQNQYVDFDEKSSLKTNSEYDYNKLMSKITINKEELKNK